VLFCALAAACKPGGKLTYTTATQQLTAVARTVEARLRAFDQGGRVTIEQGRLVVELPRGGTPEVMRELLEPPGVLRFARVDDDVERAKQLAAYVEADATAHTMGVSWVAGFIAGPDGRSTPDVFLSGNSHWLQKYLDGLPPEQATPSGHCYVIEKPQGRQARTYYLDLAGAVVVTRVVEARVVERPFGLPGYAVNVKLVPEDGERLTQLTTAIVGQRMAIVLDDRALSVPRVQTPLPGGAQLSTDGSRQSSTRLAAILAGGALPASLHSVSGSP
jgi:preprotein translocase subunit SecD